MESHHEQEGRLLYEDQVAIVNEEYTPSAEEVEYARKVIRMDEEAAASGRGSFQIDGKMIDVPIVVRAQKLLARHEAIKQREARTLQCADSTGPSIRTSPR